ncbi:MAG TPA: sigma-70 family RNA polymerase sigma factor [Solirubrobacterales bacterium]|nr:sigma-70 family RNA polymerase sigma factor [Solirubrobacterales bacterium]
MYEELRRPARAMVRRAFRSAFDDDEVEDIYANAWVGTLRALERRHDQLDDEEVRKYVLTAVANHASKELRRRRRRPTAPLEAVHSVPDDGITPDERAAKLEQSRVTRDLLASLPPRRRAVMLLRYGWGLEPQQVCGLVRGLSPRAYRKEITRGVDELLQKMRLVERGEWCADRESVLKAYAAGLADSEQQRQAQQHLSHCRHCSEFVGRLAAHLHDLGSSVAVASAVDAMDGGRMALPDRVFAAFHRIHESASNAFGEGSGSQTPEAVGQVGAASGAARGAGAAGSGVLAKLATLGTAGKVAALCLGGGAAATACVAAGIVPAQLPGLSGASGGAPQHPAEHARVIGAALPGATNDRRAVEPAPPASVSNAGNRPAADAPGDQSPAPPAPAPPPPQPTPSPIAPSAPPPEQEFGVAAATPSTSSGGSSSSSAQGGGSAVQREFGP